jgi:hypothetical protein
MNAELERLRAQFNDRLAIREKRPGIQQLVMPLYHEDGDMVDVFVETSPSASGTWRVCDHGMTLMRLSYSYDVNTPKKEAVLRRILAENGLAEDNGNLFLDVTPDRLYPAVLQFAQGVAKVGSMRYFKREVIQNLFEEMLDEFVTTKLARFHPRADVAPLPGEDAYAVDYCFNDRPRPIYLFGVNNSAKARLATVCCQHFLLERIPFRSIAVLQDLEVLPRKDQARLMTVADKEFPSLEDFKAHGEEYFERESV